MNQTNVKNDPYTKVTTFGEWVNSDSGYKWRTKKFTRRYIANLGIWQDESEEVKEQSPEEIGLVRSANINILYLKEIESLDSIDGKIRTWFKVPVQVKINPNMENNLWLKHSEGRLFLINCDPDLPQAIEIGLQNCENYTTKEGKAVKLTPKQAQELAKTTHYVFQRKINNEYVYTVSAV